VAKWSEIMRLKVVLFAAVAVLSMALLAYGMVYGGSPYIALNTLLAQIAVMALGGLVVIWGLKK
jgi:hypothetical protein